MKTTTKYIALSIFHIICICGMWMFIFLNLNTNAFLILIGIMCLIAAIKLYMRPLVVKLEHEYRDLIKKLNEEDER
jgi:hypothetical protein